MFKAHKHAVNSTFCDLLSNGYTREQSKSFKMKIMPLMLIKIISIFYHVADKFAKANDEYIDISEDKLTITSIKNDLYLLNSTYLEAWFKSKSKQMITWTFKINKLKENLHFGIVSKEDHIGMPFWQWLKLHRPCYLVDSCGTDRFDGELCDGDLRFAMCPLFYEGGIISFTLDLKHKELRCKIDDEAPRLILANISVEYGIKYKLALSLHDKGDSITLKNCYEHN